VRRTQRRRRTKLHDDLRYAALVGLQPVERVLEDRQVERRILRERRRPDERHLRSPRARDGGHLFVAGRDDHALDQLRGETGGDAVGEQGNAAKRPDVLARDRLGAAPGGDDRDDAGAAHQAVQPPSTTRLLPVMYDEASDSRKRSAPQYSWRSAIRPI